jgi:hypothetical protein
VLTLAAQNIDWQTLRLAHNVCALLDRPQQHVYSANALHQHSTDALWNLAEWLQRVVGLLEAVLVVDVEVTRHRFVVGIARMDGVVISKWEEIPEEFLDHSFKLFVVQWLLR